ncbi:hypothetical protein [Geoalkalibacter halelectricus]|uniref:TnsE C-terminal domain-containing protein n=1 Tax=Geoalkalibacter halelectricus TaxID=2847045 RepID=A0ABY5ZS96_9BACT|nr:hypothetical protein [Geoalkalibacter halelectricus]MDO3377715.1 hypothetical protein [Geoalkalibacter halelectricus]UWZ81503.1 hypothetical protein L9S41_08925 [Geoalkalibacter halelectricus]
MTEISLKSLPRESKLILLGDWFRAPGKGWKVACYFLNEQKEAFRKAFPVDLLPALIPGTVYPRLSVVNNPSGYKGTFKVPEMEAWERCRYRDLPDSLKRMREYSGEIDTQIIYRINSGDRVMWLPATELARMLFFHSAEVVRAAAYQGNTWQLAKSNKEGWIGEITFSSNVPVNYLNNLQFRKFFAWLLFDSDVENSFCSIFRRLNQKCFFENDYERWTFDLQPPDLSFCEISWAGYTGSDLKGEKSHFYIREIRSIAGLPSPQLETIFFAHPDDDFFLTNEGDNRSLRKKGERYSQSKTGPIEIDPNNPPRPGRKRYLLHIAASGLHFDAEIDLRRSPRHIKALPKSEEPDISEPEVEETVGITESSDHGNIPRADFDHLQKPELIEAPEKMVFFQTMLKQLEAEHGWTIETHFGKVPQKNCRSAHLIDGRPRQYCHAVLNRDVDTLIQILEIELKPEESLSSLFFRSKAKSSVDEILDALMMTDPELNYKAMQWKRKMNAELTLARHYLEHPDKKIKSETEALEAWVARAADRIMRM